MGGYNENGIIPVSISLQSNNGDDAKLPIELLLCKMKISNIMPKFRDTIFSLKGVTKKYEK